MSKNFDDDDKQDLLKRGFNEENISYLESLDSDDKKPLYLKITEVMNSGVTPEQIMEAVRRLEKPVKPDEDIGFSKLCDFVKHL